MIGDADDWVSLSVVMMRTEKLWQGRLGLANLFVSKVGVWLSAEFRRARRHRI